MKGIARQVFLTVVFLFGFTRFALAANLCDASCNLVITFSAAGSIEAVEAMTLTFGSGGELTLGNAGTINTNPQPDNTDFSAGGSLFLNAGDSIYFSEGGVLNLGAGGNIDYSVMGITVTGDMTISAIGGAQMISFHGGTLSLAGGTLTLNSDVDLDNTTELSSDSTISGFGAVSVSGALTLPGGNIIDSTSATLTINDINTLEGVFVNGGTIILDTSSLTVADTSLCTDNGSDCILVESKSSGEKPVATAKGQASIALSLMLSFVIFLFRSGRQVRPHG